MDKKAVGKNLAALRKAKNQTQEELGEILGVSNKTVSRWETGAFLPDAETLFTLSELYGVSVDDLLSASAEPKAEKKDPFTREERIAFWKQNWMAENKSWLLFSVLLLLALLALGILLKKPVLIGALPLLGLFLYGYWNNKKDSYVEKNAYRDFDKK